MKLKRGQKLCPKCGEVQAARQCECKHCGYQMRQRKSKTQTIHDWTELEKGDFIKVFQGTGSYYLNSEGDRVYLSVPGAYKVYSTDENGIHCYGVGKRNSGMNYVYMGPHMRSPVFSSIYRNPHKIVKIKAPRAFISKNGV